MSEIYYAVIAWFNPWYKIFILFSAVYVIAFAIWICSLIFQGRWQGKIEKDLEKMDNIARNLEEDGQVARLPKRDKYATEKYYFPLLEENIHSPEENIQYLIENIQSEEMECFDLKRHLQYINRRFGVVPETNCVMWSLCECLKARYNHICFLKAMATVLKDPKL